MKITILICFAFLPALLIGQENWSNIITQDKPYSQILNECESYFSALGHGNGKNESESDESEYNQYRRWKQVMDSRAMPNEKLKNYAAIHTDAYFRSRLAAGKNRSTTGDWENIGPFDQYGSDTWSGGGMGRVICTGFHPTNNNIFWVGTASGGLWKTTDGGLNWTPICDALASIGITSIVVHPTNPNIMYILTGDGNASDCASVGIFKTIDGGLSWMPTGLNFSASEKLYGYKLIMHPTNPEVLFVGFRNNGMYRTANGGATFVQEIQADTTVWDIEFIPGDPNQILASTNMGLMRSINGGLTWIVDNDPSFPTSFERMAVAISPSQPGNVYVIFGGDTNVNGTFRGCFKSTDYGGSFQMQSNTPNILGGATDGNNGTDQAWRDLSIIVDPLNDSRLYAGGVNVWKSEDSGLTWGRETWWTHNFEPLDPFVHADQQCFYWQGTTLFTNNDGGVFKSTDYGNDWTDLSSGLGIGQFYQIDILNNEYIGGLQDNGTMEGTMNNIQSHEILGGDGFGCVWHTGDNSIKYLSVQDAIIRRQFGSNIYIWEESNAFWYVQIEMHTTNPDYFFINSSNNLFRGHQNGPIWNFEWEDLNTSTALGSGIRAFSQCTSNPEVMYVISYNDIIKTENLSASTPAWETLPNPILDSANVCEIVVDPNNANRVWIAADKYKAGVKIFYSDNGGDTWLNISGSIENVPVRSIAYATGANAGLYVGTEIGMYFKGDAMTDWVPFANFLPNTMVMDIVISGGYVYAGTHGRGIWRSHLYTPCPTTLTLTQANDPSNPPSIGTQWYFVSNTISSSRIIPGTIGNEIYYISGIKTDLLPGFRGEAGSFVEIKVDGCPD